MRKLRRDKITGEPLVSYATNSHTRGCKLLELHQRTQHRTSMALQYPLVFPEKSRQGNRFGRGEGEVVKDAPIGRVLFTLSPRRVQALRQFFAGLGMLVFTQPQEILCSD